MVLSREVAGESNNGGAPVKAKGLGPDLFLQENRLRAQRHPGRVEPQERSGRVYHTGCHKVARGSKKHSEASSNAAVGSLDGRSKPDPENSIAGMSCPERYKPGTLIPIISNLKDQIIFKSRALYPYTRNPYMVYEP